MDTDSTKDIRREIIRLMNVICERCFYTSCGQAKGEEPPCVAGRMFRKAMTENTMERYSKTQRSLEDLVRVQDKPIRGGIT